MWYPYQWCYHEFRVCFHSVRSHLQLLLSFMTQINVALCVIIFTLHLIRIAFNCRACHTGFVVSVGKLYFVSQRSLQFGCINTEPFNNVLWIEKQIRTKITWKNNAKGCFLIQSVYNKRIVIVSDKHVTFPKPVSSNNKNSTKLYTCELRILSCSNSIGIENF